VFEGGVADVAGWVGYDRAGTLAEMTNPSFRPRRLRTYPIGAFIRVRMVSGREIEAQISKIETTALGTFLHVEFEQEIANVTGQQILGYYDFCFLKKRIVRS
jgi:hypothetical protein